MQNNGQGKELTLYMRAGCHLCEEMKREIAPLVRLYKATLREIDIDADPELKARYNEEVPVLFVGERKAAKYHVDLEQLERQLSSES
jgi:glutaredoxin